MGGYVDPLGFTKQTATILRGLGAAMLIPECKRRNISSELLHELDVDDFIVLGADESKAKEFKKQLSRTGRSRFGKVTAKEKLNNCLEIVKDNGNQISLIQAFVAYARLRLEKQRINLYVDADKCVSATDIFPLSINATLAEVEEVDRSIRKLEQFISRMNAKPKRTSIRFCLLFGALGFTALAFVLKMRQN